MDARNHMDDRIIIQVLQVMSVLLLKVPEISGASSAPGVSLTFWKAI